MSRVVGTLNVIATVVTIVDTVSRIWDAHRARKEKSVVTELERRVAELEARLKERS